MSRRSTRDDDDRFAADLEAMKSIMVTRDFALTEAIRHVFSAEVILLKDDNIRFDLATVNGRLGVSFQAHTTLATLWASIAMQLKDYPEGISTSGEE